MFKCIICMNEFHDDEKSDEHIFPDSIGGTLHIYEVCHECNSQLGRFIDSPLTNNLLMQARRQELGLKGKKGALPNVLAKGRLASDPDVEVYFKPDTKDPDKRFIIGTKVRKSADGKRIEIVVDKQNEGEIPDILATFEKRARRDGKTFTLIDQKETSEHPTVTYRGTFDSINWQPGILKIAYELACKVLGSQYLDDPVAERIRTVLRRTETSRADLEAAKLRGTLKVLGEDERPSWFFADNARWLTGALLPTAGRITCYVNVLNVFDGTIAISESADLYQLGEGGRIFVTDVISKKTLEDDVYSFAIKCAGDEPD